MLCEMTPKVQDMQRKVRKMTDINEKYRNDPELDEPSIKPRTAIVPGSFDPVTLGHLDIIRRAAKEYDEVYAVIFVNPKKTYTFSLSDRVRMLMLATDDIDNCLVSYSSGLVIDYMRDHGIETIVKGYRNDADYKYECEMAEWNKKMGGYDTVLLPASEALTEVSSTKVRELIRSGGDLTGLLPEAVIEAIRSL